jgi:hypothetical protein
VLDEFLLVSGVARAAMHLVYHLTTDGIGTNPDELIAAVPCLSFLRSRVKNTDARRREA